ncbi:MAG: zf-HC2 domain-containing protein [Chitinispirillaceae bacterium]|jgi:hypothetical protein
MECRKWEEFGLLYSADELGSTDKQGFEEHLKECEDCRKELFCYRGERERFFTPEILGESPSAKVDAEILRVCSDPRPKIRIATPILLPAFFRKALVPVMLFVIGFISVGYIMMNMENARQTYRTTAAVQQQTLPAQPRVAQKTADSAKETDVNYARTRGDLNDKGVFTVDLKK